MVMAIGGKPQLVRGVKSLQTALTVGGSMTWLPEDETVATTIYITENGKYSAENTGYYGYYKVDVMVAGGDGAEIETDNEDGTVKREYVTPPVTSESGSSLVVKDPNTGNTIYYHINNSGQLISEVVPSYAMVTTKPKEQYARNETVDYTGAVITLYNGDGTVATGYNNGVIQYGSTAWNNYVVTESGRIDDILHGNLVVMLVKPWWYTNGTNFDSAYYLRAFYSVEVA